MLNVHENRVRAFQFYALVVHSIALILLIYAGLQLTDGVLIYSLDDPYIHLAVAESIVEGGDGINSEEFASPSSSILFPFLLAFGLHIGLGGELLPLILSVPFSLAGTWIMSGFAWRTVGKGGGRIALSSAIILGPSIILATNAIALPMTGMEHSIHVFATILALTGLYRLSLEPSSRISLASVMLGTLLCATIRFEGLALVVAMVAAIYSLGLRWHAILTGSLVLIILSTYAVLMNSLGLPIFPSSVMTKSDIAANAGDGNAFGVLSGLLTNIWNSLNSRWGMLFAIVSVILLAAAFAYMRDDKNRRIFTLAVVFILGSHIIAGRYGWFGRYEVYIVAAMLIGLISLDKFFPKSVTTLLSAPLLLLIVGAPYAWTTFKTPEASANIYQQQYQMHRFVQEYFPERVAVNDLGYVAFKNENYVLDLWGLGSEEARRLSSNNQWTPDLLDRITHRYEIAYAMIYTDWFGEIPANWCRAADLVTSQVTSAGNTVSFYLIQIDRQQEMRAALLAFAADLPLGARLEIFDCEHEQ